MIAEALIVQLRRELVLDREGCLQGWTTPERGVEMAELVINFEPGLIVEIGCFGGRSTIAMGLALKELGRGKLYTIDPWKRSDCLESENDANKGWWQSIDLDWVHKGAMEAFWRLGLDEYVIPIRAQSQYVHQLFTNIDMLNIDGNHAEVPSCRDVQNYVPKVRKDGIILFDDCDWETTRKAQGLILDYADCVKDGATYKIFKVR
jgi:predicted O-methyltransferase YrrM